MSERLVLAAIVLAAVSGIPGLFMRRSSLLGQRLAAAISVTASVIGLCGVLVFWGTAQSEPIVREWAIPGAQFHVAMDGLSALFLVPVFFVSALGCVYGLSYWKQTEHPENGRKLRLFYGLMPAGMALLVVARNSILFLVGWEVMALSAYFLVTTEDQKAAVRETGWIYLVATKVATVSLFALFGLLRAVSGSFTLAPLSETALTPGIATSVFVLALVGFGIKAGIMPFHVWLPSSHAIAPSHVSALLSGVILKMGIYGLVRILSLAPHPPLAWGGCLLGLGVVSGVLGVAFAIGQHDLKRLLAYHSIENIGIIVMGIGLAVLGRTLHRPEWVVLGFAGGLLHVWNHAFFKGLLFLSAGSVIHTAKTREIDQLGGLARRMPWTALAFMVGAVAICGLPPLNGFVSEFLIYLGLFDTLGLGGRPAYAGASFAAPALALIGALALACFVKVFGAVFLGTPRSEPARHAHESPQSMLASMFALVLACLVIGLAPLLVAPVLDSAVAACSPGAADIPAAVATLAPLGAISGLAAVLVVGLTIVGGWLWIWLRNSAVERGSTWGCGFAAPTPRIQYTASSFAEMLVGLFRWALRPRIHRERITELFPQASSFHSHVPDPVLDEVVLPTFSGSARLFACVRVLQQGRLQMYLLYIFVVLIALLIWH